MITPGGKHENEVFGPVAAVRSFADIDEAVTIANDSKYGLSLGVLTPDVGLGLEIANRIHTGIAHVNDQKVLDTPLAPMGGVRSSGAGSHVGGLGNLAAFTETRWTTVTAAPAARG